MKKALLVGINYLGTANQLGGCINDVLNVREVLLNHYGYSKDNILLLTDGDIASSNSRAPYLPTKSNIIAACWWLLTSDPATVFNPVRYNEQSPVSDGQYYFHYSGHGTRIQESSTLHDAICPLDFPSAGMIDDNELSRHLTHRVNSRSTLHATLDACHSANCFDLDWTYVALPLNLGYTLRKTGNFPPTQGQVILLSGCQDDQTSADLITTNYQGQRQDQGALTCILLKVLATNNYHLPCGQLLHEICMGIKPLSSQVPALTFGQQTDINIPYQL